MRITVEGNSDNFIAFLLLLLIYNMNDPNMHKDIKKSFISSINSILGNNSYFRSTNRVLFFNPS